MLGAFTFRGEAVAAIEPVYGAVDRLVGAALPSSPSMSRPVQNSKTGLGLVLGGQINANDGNVVFPHGSSSFPSHEPRPESASYCIARCPVFSNTEMSLKRGLCGFGLRIHPSRRKVWIVQKPPQGA